SFSRPVNPRLLPSFPTRRSSDLVAQNYFGLAPMNQDQRTITLRLDHRLSDRDQVFGRFSHGAWDQMNRRAFSTGGNPITSDNLRSEEHTSELQSQSNLVCRLLLE